MVRRASTETFQRLEHIRDDLHAAHRRPARPALARRRDARVRAGRDLQPRRDVVRGRLLDPARADGRVHRRSGVTRMLEAMRDVAPEARFYQASSSEMFGKVQEVPQTESDPLLPAQPLRRGQGATATSSPSTTASRYDLFACSGILFNHESPRRGLEFVTRKVTHGAAAIKLGLTDELALGNLDARARLGLREGLRRGDVADAPAGRARRLRDRHRRGPQRPASWSTSPSSTSGSTPSDHVAPRPALPAPGRGRAPDRRPREGAREARLGAADELRGAGAA